MKKTFEKLVSMLLLTAFLLSAAACAKGGEAADVPPEKSSEEVLETQAPQKPAFAVCVPYIDHPNLRALVLGMEDACKAEGYDDISILMPKEGENAAEGMKNAALDWAKSVEGRPAAIAYLPVTYESEYLPYKQLKDMGIYVALPNNAIFTNQDELDLDSSLLETENYDKVQLPEGVDFETCSNKYKGGKYAAREVAEHIDGKNGEVVITSLTINASNYAYAGFKSEFERLRESYDLSGITLNELSMLGTDFEEAEDTAEALLDKNVIAVFDFSGIKASLWEEALEKAGRDRKDVFIEYMGPFELNAKAYVDNDIDGLIGFSLYEEGYNCINLFCELFSGKSVEKFTLMEPKISEEELKTMPESYERAAKIIEDDDYFEKYINR